MPQPVVMDRTGSKAKAMPCGHLFHDDCLISWAGSPEIQGTVLGGLGICFLNFGVQETAANPNWGSQDEISLKNPGVADDSSCSQREIDGNPLLM